MRQVSSTLSSRAKSWRSPMSAACSSRSYGSGGPPSSRANEVSRWAAPGLFGQRGQLRTVARRPFGRLRGTNAAGPRKGPCRVAEVRLDGFPWPFSFPVRPGWCPVLIAVTRAAAGQGLGAAARRPAGRSGGGERCRRCPGPVAGKGAPARLGPGGGAGAEYRGTWRGGTRYGGLAEVGGDQLVKLRGQPLRIVADQVREGHVHVAGCQVHDDQTPG
jgi:hypothetical protein